MKATRKTVFRTTGSISFTILGHKEEIMPDYSKFMEQNKQLDTTRGPEFDSSVMSSGEKHFVQLEKYEYGLDIKKKKILK